MASILMLADGRKLDVDRFYADGGRPAIMGAMGGQTTVFQTATPPKPTIYEKKGAFFTLDGKPITEAIAAPWLDDPAQPDSLKARFRTFLDGVKAGKPVREKLTTVRKARPPRHRSRELAPEEAGLSSQQAERV